MTVEKAVRQAGAEGLMLLKSDNVTGYKGVRIYSRHNFIKPYEATVHLLYLVSYPSGRN